MYETGIRFNIASAKSYLQTVAQSGSHSGGNFSGAQRVKLPQIVLSKFDDTIVGWSSFWDNFSSAVDSRKDLTPSQKFTYLRGQLQGDSLTLIERLPVDDANYPIAVSLLKETYDNKIIGIINQIDNLQSIKLNSYNLASVRKFRAEFESIVASLEILGCKIADNNSAETIVIALILNKLPHTMKDNIMRTAGKSIMSLAKFRDALKIELDLLCSNNSVSSNSVKSKTNSNKSVNNSNNNEVSNKQLVDQNVSTASTFSVVTDSAKESKGKQKNEV